MTWQNDTLKLCFLEKGMQNSLLYFYYSTCKVSKNFSLMHRFLKSHLECSPTNDSIHGRRQQGKETAGQTQERRKGSLWAVRESQSQQESKHPKKTLLTAVSAKTLEYGLSIWPEDPIPLWIQPPTTRCLKFPCLCSAWISIQCSLIP